MNKASIKVNVLSFPKVICYGHNTILFQAAQSSNAFDKMSFFQCVYHWNAKKKVSYPVSSKFAKNSFPGVLDRDPGDEAGGRVEWLSAHVTHLRLGRCVQKHRCHQNVLAGDFSFI